MKIQLIMLINVVMQYFKTVVCFIIFGEIFSLNGAPLVPFRFALKNQKQN